MNLGMKTFVLEGSISPNLAVKEVYGIYKDSEPSRMTTFDIERLSNALKIVQLNMEKVRPVTIERLYKLFIRHKFTNRTEFYDWLRTC